MFSELSFYRYLLKYGAILGSNVDTFSEIADFVILMPLCSENLLFDGLGPLFSVLFCSMFPGMLLALVFFSF